jgi:hypothetical protein
MSGRGLFRRSLAGARGVLQDLVLRQVCRLHRARSGDLLVVQVHCWEGMFCHLEWFLEISVHCEKMGLRPCFMSSSPPYVDPSHGPDWFSYFFFNPQLTQEDDERIRSGRVPICRIAHIGQLGLPEDYDSQLSLSTAPALVRRYIGVKPSVLDKVDTFCNTHLKERRVLGLHYRGTDKRVEAPRMRYSQVCDTVARFLEDNDEYDSLFVASDESDFVRYVENAFKNALPVIYHDDRERSQGTVGVHQTPSGDRFRRGEEAVLNCLLLSRCAALIKTPSILSGWSKLFNPALDVTMLASPFERHLWFPDRELVRKAESRHEGVRSIG